MIRGRAGATAGSSRSAITAGQSILLTFVIVVAALFLAETYSPAGQAGTTARTIAAPCPTKSNYSWVDSASASSNQSGVIFPILSVPKSSTAVVCVTYYDMTHNQTTIDTSKGLIVGNFKSQVFLNGTVINKLVAAPTVVSVAANPSIIVLGGKHPDNMTVAYTLATTSQSVGLYFLNIPGIVPISCSDEFRLAVGYTLTSANVTGKDFKLPANFGTCSASAGGYTYAHVYALVNVRLFSLFCDNPTCDIGTFNSTLVTPAPRE